MVEPAYELWQFFQAAFDIFPRILPVLPGAGTLPDSRIPPYYTSERLQLWISEKMRFLTHGDEFVVFLPPAFVSDFHEVLGFRDDQPDSPVLILVFEVNVLSNFGPLLRYHYIMPIYFINYSINSWPRQSPFAPALPQTTSHSVSLPPVHQGYLNRNLYWLYHGKEIVKRVIS